MQFEGTTYRPPPEADSMLLQVTVGCAHNRCTFCDMYSDVRFRVVEMDQIEADIREARGIYPNADRIFLVNGDAFVLKTETLEEIAGKIKQYFPENQTISMYASIRNIKAKTDIDLRILRDLGINDLYVGIESGADEVVTHLNKGHTIEEAKYQLARLKQAGIHHRVSLMLGAAGKGKGIESARLTAAFLNDTGPNLVWVGTLSVFKGTALYDEIQAGDFIPATELEILEEEKELIRNIDLANVPFYGVHPTNAIPVSGILPRDREKMIHTIDCGIKGFDKVLLSGVMMRRSL